jgi:hypothetical protein
VHTTLGSNSILDAPLPKINQITPLPIPAPQANFGVNKEISKSGEYLYNNRGLLGIIRRERGLGRGIMPLSDPATYIRGVGKKCRVAVEKLLEET